MHVQMRKDIMASKIMIQTLHEFHRARTKSSCSVGSAT